ncbi:hypothetical protein K438DRAFT_2089198 [Mycena galopus ATCC 62051]|nr:hypothetical protein K438DRAFT_2089198 [Mycena galopus ATCC 62051]
MYRYRASRTKWHRMSSPDHTTDEDDIPPSTIDVVSWNVDFSTPMPAKRMETTLRHLEKVVFKCRDGEAPDPCVILLQEVHAVHGLEALLRDNWVRRHFTVTPADVEKWPKHAQYGNVTLVEKSIPVVEAHVLEFGLSQMQRTGVIVDIQLGAPKPRDYNVVVRIINTHLESLRGGDDIRPEQLKLLTKILKVWTGGTGGIISGDMNPIGPQDADAPEALGLRMHGQKMKKTRRATLGENSRSIPSFPPQDSTKYCTCRGEDTE